MDHSSDEIFLGRQPILDLSHHLFAYELLFRNSQINAAHVADNVHATATVIVNTFNELGVETALGDRRGFINVDEAFLFSDTLELLPPHAVVLEILETVRPSAPVIARCRELQAAGYTLALDDIIQVRPEFNELLALVQIIKVDIAPLDRDELAQLAAKLQPLGKQLLAEKVESQEQMEYCRTLGFSLFQGYFFARPSIIAGKRVDYGRLALLKLLGLALVDADTTELEDVLKREPGLVVKLLRMINSVGAGTTTTITSLRHAITLLGRRHLLRWAQLLIFASATVPGKGNPLLTMAAARGRLLELLAIVQEPRNIAFADEAFMTGVMSMMPSAFGVPIAEIVGPLNLPAPVHDALCERSGLLGRMLDLAEGGEQGDVLRISTALAEIGLSTDQFNHAQADALAWSTAIERGNDA